MRIGTGYDIHRLVEGRPFPLGGVLLDHPRGPHGYSDGDTLAHALIDALLGAAALGDIGQHFPPGDPQWRGADSIDLLHRTLTLVHDAGFRVHNVDTTVILEAPRLGPYLPAVRERLAQALALPLDRVSVKAKSNEGLDAVGQREAVAVHAVALLEELNA